MVVAQLAELTNPMPVVCGSNLLYLLCRTCLTVNCRKDVNKVKKPGI